MPPPLTGLRFDINGDVQYSRAFLAYAHEVNDLREPLADIGKLLLLSVSEQFRTEGSAGLGSKWQPLNDQYAIWKEQQVGDQPILVFHGDMRAAMTDPRSLLIGPRKLVYEVNDPKAIYHQEGEGNLPARKMVSLTEAVKRSWDRAFASWLNGLRRGPLWTGH